MIELICQCFVVNVDVDVRMFVVLPESVVARVVIAVVEMLQSVVMCCVVVRVVVLVQVVECFVVVVVVIRRQVFLQVSRLVMAKCRLALVRLSGSVVVWRLMTPRPTRSPFSVARLPTWPGICLFVCCDFHYCLVYDSLKSRNVLSSASIDP